MGSDVERAKNAEMQPGLEALTREVRANRRQSEGNGEDSVAPRRSNRTSVVGAGNTEQHTSVEDINAGDGADDGGGGGGDDGGGESDDAVVPTAPRTTQTPGDLADQARTCSSTKTCRTSLRGV